MAMKRSYIIYILFILLPNVVTMAQSVESDELFSKGVHLYNMKKYKEAIGVKELFGEKGYSTLERNSCRPSFDVACKLPLPTWR